MAIKDLLGKKIFFKPWWSYSWLKDGKGLIDKEISCTGGIMIRFKDAEGGYAIITISKKELRRKWFKTNFEILI